MKVMFEISDKDFVVATTTSNTGVSKSKTITVDEFISIISDAREYQSKKMIDTSKYLLFVGDEQTFECIKVVPSTEWAITYMNKPMIVKLPTLLFKVNNKGDMQIFVTNVKYPKITSKVYKFDYPNMLGGNHVCFGSFVKREIKLNEVDSYINEYMATPYSHSWTESSKKGIYKIQEKHFLGTVQDLFS